METESPYILRRSKKDDMEVIVNFSQELKERPKNPKYLAQILSCRDGQ